MCTHQTLTCKVLFLCKTRLYSFLGRKNIALALTRCSLFLDTEEIRLDSHWWKDYLCMAVPTFGLIFRTPIPPPPLELGRGALPWAVEAWHMKGWNFLLGWCLLEKKECVPSLGWVKIGRLPEEKEESVGKDDFGHICAVGYSLEHHRYRIFHHHREFYWTESDRPESGYVTCKFHEFIQVISVFAVFSSAKWDITSVSPWKSQLDSHQKPPKIQLDHISQLLLQFSVAVWLSSSH